MKYKAGPLRGFKALDEGKGEFEALVAVFGNVDLAGDRIVKGAFADSLKAWGEKGRPIPVVFSHMWSDLDAHIGEVTEAKETDEGLHVRAQLDMDDPAAAKVFRLMKRGTLAEFSFAYDVVEEKVQNGANELLKLDVIEVGPTLKGMNPATQLLAVKSDDGTRTVARDGGTRAKQAVAGSFEQRRELVDSALRARYGESDRYWVWVVATFDESAIFVVHDENGSSYRQVSYTLKDGACELGDDEREVKLETVVTPKARAKEGRRNSGNDATRIQAMHDLAAELGASCETKEDDGKGADPPPVATPQDRANGKGQEPRPGVFAARVAAELLELGAD